MDNTYKAPTVQTLGTVADLTLYSIEKGSGAADVLTGITIPGQSGPVPAGSLTVTP